MRDLLWGCNSLWNGAIINHCLREALSYLCFPLWWVIPTETGWAHLIKCSEPHRQIICTGGTSATENKKEKNKNLLFKPELGQFVLWLSRQQSALNPYEDCAAEEPKMNTKSRGDDENMPSQQVEVEMGGWGLRGGVGPLWEMCLTPDFSNHERWQCCGRCQFSSDGEKCPMPHLELYQRVTIRNTSMLALVCKIPTSH